MTTFENFQRLVRHPSSLGTPDLEKQSEDGRPHQSGILKIFPFPGKGGKSVPKTRDLLWQVLNVFYTSTVTDGKQDRDLEDVVLRMTERRDTGEWVDRGTYFLFSYSVYPVLRPWVESLCQDGVVSGDPGNDGMAERNRVQGPNTLSQPDNSSLTQSLNVTELRGLCTRTHTSPDPQNVD